RPGRARDRPAGGRRRRGGQRPLAPPEDRAAQRRPLRQTRQRRSGALPSAGLGGADAGRGARRERAHRGTRVAAHRVTRRFEEIFRSVRLVRLGTPRLPPEGTRIGTVRRPPRGVPKSAFASGNWYDVWYPNLSPTPDLVKRALASQADLSAAGEK